MRELPYFCIMYLFNPEHDLCLANNDPNYVPPQAAYQYAKEHSDVLQWMQGLCPESEEDPLSIVPWGWNKVLRCRLLKQGVSADRMPSEAQLDTIRELSHRRTAAQASAYVQTHLPQIEWPPLPVFAESPEQVEQAAAQHKDWILKAPWSGSGRGLRWGRGALLPTDRGWCKNTIASQGSVEVGARAKVVQDFAMLWRCHCKLEFVGYSLFSTKNGVYSENVMWTDSQIEKHLQKYIPLETLYLVRQTLGLFLSDTFVGKYDGFLGVDQFVYQIDERYLLHPAVEINVRMTMGLLAHNKVAQEMNASFFKT